MSYIIAGTATFSSQANRDAARTRIDAAIASTNYVSYTTTFTAGVQNPTTTTMTISIKLVTEVSSEAANTLTTLFTELTSSNRPTACYLSLTRMM